MTNPIVSIPFDTSMTLVEVDDVLDNQFWRFCADDPMSDEATYEQFTMGPEAVIPAGTTVVITHLWGWNRQGGLTDPVDYELVLSEDTLVKQIVHMMLSRYQNEMDVNHADGRFYFIEEVIPVDDKKVEVVWGS